jgi:hypothetical protein
MPATSGCQAGRKTLWAAAILAAGAIISTALFEGRARAHEFQAGTTPVAAH